MYLFLNNKKRNNKRSIPKAPKLRVIQLKGLRQYSNSKNKNPHLWNQGLEGGANLRKQAGYGERHIDITNHPLGLPKCSAMSQSALVGLLHAWDVEQGRPWARSCQSPWWNTWTQWPCCVQPEGSHPGTLWFPMILFSSRQLGRTQTHA